MGRSRKEWTWDEALERFGYVKADALWRAIRERRPAAANRSVNAFITEAQASAIIEAGGVGELRAIVRQVSEFGRGKR